MDWVTPVMVGVLILGIVAWRIHSRRIIESHIATDKLTGTDPPSNPQQHASQHLVTAFLHFRSAIESVRLLTAPESLSSARQGLREAMHSGGVDAPILKRLSEAIHGASCSQVDLDEVNSRLINFSEALREYVKEERGQPRSFSTNLSGQVDTRRSLANDLKLSELALEIYEKIRHGSHLVSMEQTPMDKQESHSDEQEVRFSFRGHAYRFKIRHDWGEDAGSDDIVSATPAILTLCSENGSPLFSTGLVHQSTSQASWYAVPESGALVHGFVLGEWLTDFLALYAQVAIENKRSHLFNEVLREEHQKHNLGL